MAVVAAKSTYEKACARTDVKGWWRIHTQCTDKELKTEFKEEVANMEQETPGGDTRGTGEHEKDRSSTQPTQKQPQPSQFTQS